jgi:hypothetical protein
MAKTKRVGPDTTIEKLITERSPRWLIGQPESRAETLDLDSLERELIELARVIERINIPSQAAWEGMLVAQSLNLPMEDDRLYWAYHAYCGSERFRRVVDDYNKAVDASGLPDLARGMTPKEGSEVSLVLRAIESGRPSAALLECWFHLGVLVGRQNELLEAHDDQRRFYQINLKSGAPSASIGQHVWYARWLVENCENFKNDRATAEAELTRICRDLVSQRRTIRISNAPDGARPLWKPEWYKKLLKPQRHPSPAGKPELSDRLTRLTRVQVDRLAKHKHITAALLPPLRVTDFASDASHR